MREVGASHVGTAFPSLAAALKHTIAQEDTVAPAQEDAAPRVAVVTGGGTGIGRAVCAALLTSGWTVVAAGRRVEPLEDAVAGFADGVAHCADVTDPLSVERLFARVEQEHGRVDLLFNNAGVFGSPAGIDEYPLRVWDDVVATNLNGYFYCARLAFGMMRRQAPQGGRIINNGSLSAQVPRPFAIGYTATKHAITGLTKAIALEGRQYRIACGQIDIGNARTAMADALARGVPQADGSVRAEPTMDIELAAEAVVTMARLPLEANIQNMTIMATTAPFIGRG
jgi:NAD(P)-dependent dehydrogenase (short-subunit alcohol dehydrogenase family)